MKEFLERPIAGVYVMAVFLMCARSGHAREFTVVGELTYAHGTNAEPTATAGFTVMVKDCCWQIIMTHDTTTPFLDSHSVGSDGTDIYELELYNDTVFGQQASPQAISKVPSRTYGHGYVYPGTIPNYNPFLVNQLWFAYASGCYVNNLTTNRLTCTLLHPKNKADCTVKASWRTDAGDPEFVREAALYNEGVVELLDGSTIPLAPPYDHGFAKYVYKVLGETNIAGAKIASDFRMDLFDRAPQGQSAADLVSIWHVSGVVTGLPNVPDSASCVPQIVTNTFVQDYRSGRVSRAENVSYFTTGTWLRADSREFKALISGVPFKPKGQEIRTMVRALLVLLILLCPALLWRARTRKA
jgi:hypothetical protein